MPDSIGNACGVAMPRVQLHRHSQCCHTSPELHAQMRHVRSMDNKVTLGRHPTICHTQVNQYPGERDFKAIGSGGDDFKQNIVEAVEAIVGPVRKDRIMQRPSSKGKFISVTLQNVKVQNPDQVGRCWKG